MERHYLLVYTFIIVGIALGSFFFLLFELFKAKKRRMERIPWLSWNHEEVWFCQWNEVTFYEIESDSNFFFLSFIVFLFLYCVFTSFYFPLKCHTFEAHETFLLFLVMNLMPSNVCLCVSSHSFQYLFLVIFTKYNLPRTKALNVKRHRYYSLLKMLK